MGGEVDHKKGGLKKDGLNMPNFSRPIGRKPSQSPLTQKEAPLVSPTSSEKAEKEKAEKEKQKKISFEKATSFIREAAVLLPFIQEVVDSFLDSIPKEYEVTASDFLLGIISPSRRVQNQDKKDGQTKHIEHTVKTISRKTGAQAIIQNFGNLSLELASNTNMLTGGNNRKQEEFIDQSIFEDIKRLEEMEVFTPQTTVRVQPDNQEIQADDPKVVRQRLDLQEQLRKQAINEENELRALEGQPPIGSNTQEIPPIPHERRYSQVGLLTTIAEKMEEIESFKDNKILQYREPILKAIQSIIEKDKHPSCKRVKKQIAKLSFNASTVELEKTGYTIDDILTQLSDERGNNLNYTDLDYIKSLWSSQKSKDTMSRSVSSLRSLMSGSKSNTLAPSTVASPTDETRKPFFS